MNSKPSLQTLPVECLVEVLSYVPLPECMFLRSSCRQLKAAVDCRFRTGVRTLRVLFSAPQPEKDIKKFRKFFKQLPDCKTRLYKQMSFGSLVHGASWCKMEDVRMFEEVSEEYTRGEQYLVLSNKAKFDSFVNFITKYMPGVTKLALVLDHDDYLSKIPIILDIYRKQLKGFLLERTLQSSVKVKKSIEDEWTFANGVGIQIHGFGKEPKGPVSWELNEWDFELPEALLHSVNGLQALEELYFLTKRFPMQLLRNQTKEVERKFVDELFKLKVLHLTIDSAECGSLHSLLFSPKVEVFEQLEELLCDSDDFLSVGKVSYPRLEKLTLFNGGSIKKFKVKQMPNLRQLRFDEALTICDKSIKVLNSFPHLQRLQCTEVIPRQVNPVPNRTIKFIEIEKLRTIHYEDPVDFGEPFDFEEIFTSPEPDFFGASVNFDDPESKYNKETELKNLRECLKAFKNLENVIIREPFIELNSADLIR